MARDEDDLLKIKFFYVIKFEQIKRDRDYIRQNLLITLDNSINAPLKIRTIIAYMVIFIFI